MQVKEKTVEPVELFYDLIYVYAVSGLTLLVEEPVGGNLGMLLLNPRRLSAIGQ